MITKKEINELKKMACTMRMDVVHMGPRSGNVPHVGPAFSCADIVSALYFHFMNVRPEDPHWEDRDRFVISKGHGALCVYSALAHRGFFSVDELWKIKQVGAMLQGHPDMKKIPGIDATTGSLGNGMSFALGIAAAMNLGKKSGKVYCLLGDGEAQEGIVWEAAMYAGAKKLDNFITILDYNHQQGSGVVDDIIDMEPLKDCWKKFGWRVLEINGNCMEEVCSALEMAQVFHGGPTLIVAHTIKGNGVSFMEDNNDWHSKMVNEEEYKTAIAELEAQYKSLEEEAV